MKSIGRLEAVSFITGFSLMAFELAAARILAPSIGSSTYIWTSVIGVIIAALSLGYFIGGVIADRRGYRHDISWLMLMASVLVLLAALIYPEVLNIATEWTGVDIRIRAVIVALVLFAPASFVIGAISPYLAKLRVHSLSSSGRSVASLSALNSIGGIAGTFVTGFILFGYIGSKETILVVAALLALGSWLPEWRHRIYLRSGLVVLIVMACLLSTFGIDTKGVMSIDTASAHYEVVDFVYDNTQVRGLLTGPTDVQSAVRLDNPSELVFWYTNTLAELTLSMQPKSVLVLGGGTFTLPEYLAAKLPEATVDVVEIDPKLEDIAREYFNFKGETNLNLIFEDARTFVEQTDKTYDVVITDVYNEGAIPFSLATREYGIAVAKLVNPKGIVLANIIGGLVGPCRSVLDAINNAYAQGLPYSSYVVDPSSGTVNRANFIIRYSRSGDAAADMIAMPNQPSDAYTDNYAPFERLYYACSADSD